MRDSRAPVRVGSIVVRCARFDELLAFWQAALGYVAVRPPHDGWVILTDPTGAGPNISLDRVARHELPPLGDLSRVHLGLDEKDVELAKASAHERFEAGTARRA